MGGLVSFVPRLLAEKKISNPEFVREMWNRGVSPDTSYRMIRGETNFNVETLRVAAQVLGVGSLNEVIDIAENGQH